MSRANAAVELLSRNLGRHPDRVAFCCGDRSLTFRELELACRGFAAMLRKRGISPGERVMIVLPDSLAFPVAFLGSLLAGALAVAVRGDAETEELEFIAKECGAQLLVTYRGAPHHSDIAGGIGTIICGEDGSPLDRDGCADFADPFRPSADDLAYMLYSSGTTGRPKGVPHGHRSLLLPCEVVGRSILGITGDDVLFSTSKLSFAYGLVNGLAFPLYYGATAVLHPGKPDPRNVLEIIDRLGVSVLFSVPAVYRQIVLSRRERLDLPVRLCLSAGEALPATLFEEWRLLTGLEILDGMGATETAYHFFCNRPGAAMPGSAGRLVPTFRARLVDEDGMDVPAGREGNLLIGGETITPFYWNHPGLSAERMQPDGFFRTGDICLEKEGFFFHRGRSDDMFRVDGQWVSPQTVEEALKCHPAVADCGVAPVSVGTLVRPGAFVVVKPGMEEVEALGRELSGYMKTSLPPHMRPVRFRFVDELPRTATGKLKRSMLKKQAEDG